MADPTKVEEIMDAVSIPVMAKCRIGHFVEAQVLQALGVDYIDESEVLTPADEEYHIDKWEFTVPVRVRLPRTSARRCAASREGAAMIRTKGEAGTGNVVEAVRHMRAITRRHPRLHACSRRGADARGQGARRAARAGPEVAATGRLPS